MLPIGYMCKLAAEELEESLGFNNSNYNQLTEKTKDSQGKDCYLLRFDGANVLVYSDKNIVINGIRTKSVREAKRLLQMRIG